MEHPALNLEAQIDSIIKLSSKISPRAVDFANIFFKYALIENQDKNKGKIIMSNKDMRALFPWSYQSQKSLMSPICSRIISDYCYICLDCRECVGAVVCYECFSGGNHEGHRFIQKESYSSVCDCGDHDVWNQKGFCKMHGNNDEEIDIEDQIRKTFIPQMKFAFYLYFWLIDQNGKGANMNHFQHNYGGILLESTVNLISQEFQLKYLLNQVMHSGFDQFPELLAEKGLYIIERFFNIKDQNQLAHFNDVAAELFPVKQFQHSFLKQFFIKTYKNEMIKSYPIRSLDFQYMVRAKTISQLIEKKQMKPFLLDSSKHFDNIQSVQQVFRTYYNCIQFLIGMKSSFQYFCIHFSQVNICDMIFYRKYLLFQEQNQQIYLDQHFLKLLGQFLKIIKNEKVLLQKIIRQLTEFIKANKVQTYSLVHQRALAMTTMAYLQGDLAKLQKQEIKNILLHTMGLSKDQEKEINQFVSLEISKYLYRKVQSDLSQANWEKHVQDIHHGLIHKQGKIFLLQSLDTIYVKILIKLYNGKFEFQQFIQLWVKRLIEKKTGSLIFWLISFVYSILLLQVDQLIVNDQLGIILHKQKIYKFQKQIIKSYQITNTVEFKKIVGYFFNEQSLIEQFLTQEVKVEKGRINYNVEQRPLQILLYYGFFWKKLKTLKPNISFYYQLMEINSKDYQIYNEQVLSAIFTQTSKIYSAILNLSQQLLNRLPKFIEESIILLSFVFMTNKDKRAQVILKDFLKTISHVPTLLILKPVIEQAKRILDSSVEEKQAKDLQLKDQEDKRREALVRKRKQKQEMMKKKQAQLLKNYQKIQQNQFLETCIYCKENSNLPLYYVAYCGLSNLYEQRCLQIVDQHLYFVSCGHKIHDQCYEKYLGEVEELSICFLCKSRVNILVPFSNKQLSLSDADKFKDIVYPTLLKRYCDEDFLIEQFYIKKHQEQVVSILLQSFVRQITVKALFDPNSFVKEILPIYSSIYQVIKRQEKILKFIQLMKISIKKSKISNNTHKELQLLLLYELEEQIFKINLNKQAYQDCSVKKFCKELIQMFQKKESLHVPRLQISESIINSLPQKMIQLLPSKPVCSLCKKISTRLISCLLCPWIGCQDDKDCLPYHTRKAHLEGSVFIYLQNGEVIYLYKRKANTQQSIYFNHLRQSATTINMRSLLGKEKLAQFFLDKNEFDLIKRKVVCHQISHHSQK